MDPDGVFDMAGVTTGESGGDGDVAGAGELEDAFVASFQTGFGEAQTAKLVFAERVGTANVKQNIGAKFVERFFDGGEKCGEVFVVFDAVV